MSSWCKKEAAEHATMLQMKNILYALANIATDGFGLKQLTYVIRIGKVAWSVILLC